MNLPILIYLAALICFGAYAFLKNTVIFIAGLVLLVVGVSITTTNKKKRNVRR